ncbi:MAG: hypothetical protein R2795_16285 [Saprospiraceae bacterium]
MIAPHATEWSRQVLAQKQYHAYKSVWRVAVMGRWGEVNDLSL